MEPKPVQTIPLVDFYPVTLVFPAGETVLKPSPKTDARLSRTNRTVPAVATVHMLDRASLPKSFHLAEVSGKDIIPDDIEDGEILSLAGEHEAEIVDAVGKRRLQDAVEAFRDGSDKDSLCWLVDMVHPVSWHDRHVCEKAPAGYEVTLILPESVPSIRTRLGIPKGTPMQVEFHHVGHGNNSFFKRFVKDGFEKGRPRRI